MRLQNSDPLEYILQGDNRYLSSVVKWRGRVARAVGELTVIVVGVLIALWADSMLDRRQLEGLEHEHLVALRVDGGVAGEALQAALDRQQRQAHALRQLMVLAPDAPPDSVDSWIYHGLWLFPAYAIPFAAYDDLESAGQLELIQDPRIRQALMVIREDLSRLELMQADAAATQHSLVDPFLVSEFDLPQAVSGSEDLPLSSSGYDHRPVLQTRKARNLLTAKLILAQDVAEHVAGMSEDFEELLRLLDDRIAGVGS